MKKLTLLTIAISTLILSSCFKTDPVVYGCTDICFVQSAELKSDNGAIYHVMESNSGDWKTKQRIYASFDILESISNSEYNIRLNEYAEYVLNSAMRQSLVNPETIGSDAVYLNGGFFSGTSPYYFNIQCVYARKKNSTKIHDINLIYDDKESDSTHAVFHIRHNAFGDTYMDGVNIKDCESVPACFSYPMDEIFRRGIGLVEITIDYYWYEDSSSGTSAKTKKFEKNISVNF